MNHFKGFELFIIIGLINNVVFSDNDCSVTNTWQIDYINGDCFYHNGYGTFLFKCNTKDADECGGRLSSKPGLGYGRFSSVIKAARGSGVTTAFYLFTYGRNNDKSQPWNEIDFEIVGKKISGGKTTLLTNFWVGHGTQFPKWHTFNWDASTTYHTYTIYIHGTTIDWIIDNSLIRSESFNQYADMKNAVNSYNLQGEISLWGQNKIGWSAMGIIQDNNENFPLYAEVSRVTYGNNIDYWRRIKSKASGKCLDIHWDDRFNNGGKVQIWDCITGNINQQWYFNGSTKQIQTNTGKCLDVHLDDYNSRINGAKIQIWDCISGNSNQKWYFNGGQIVSYNGKCLDVDSGTMNNNGGKIQLWDCFSQSKSNQQWIF